MCNIYRDKLFRIEKKCCLIRNINYSLEWNAVRKVCSHKKKIILEWCKFSHQADQQQLLGGGKEGGGGGGVLWVFGQECPMWPKNP